MMNDQRVEFWKAGSQGSVWRKIVHHNEVDNVHCVVETTTFWDVWTRFVLWMTGRDSGVDSFLTDEHRNLGVGTLGILNV